MSGRRWAALGFAGLLALCGHVVVEAQAQAEPELPVDVQAPNMVNLPRESPRLTLRLLERVTGLHVEVLEGGRRVAGRGFGTLGAGGSRTLTWRAQPGVHSYVVRVSGRSARGSATVAVDIDVTVMRPLEIALDRRQVDLEERTLAFRMNNPAGGAVLTIRSASGRVLHEATTELAGQPAGAKLELSWPVLEEPIARMELRIYDASQSWSAFELLPFTVEIPHEDVVFETASAVVRESESDKLVEAHAAILEAIAEHGSDLKARLYVLGHTDTVGTPVDNLTLSRKRAIAIARWFAERGGISLPILAQGFGESRPLVKTADSVDEPKNRRAQYILATQAPAATEWSTVAPGN